MLTIKSIGLRNQWMLAKKNCIPLKKEMKEKKKSISVVSFSDKAACLVTHVSCKEKPWSKKKKGRKEKKKTASKQTRSVVEGGEGRARARWIAFAALRSLACASTVVGKVDTDL